MLDHILRQAGVETPRDSIEVSSLLTIMQLIGRSDAIAMLSESSVRDYLTGGLLVQLPVLPAVTLPGFGLLMRKGEAPKGWSRMFVEVIREVAACGTHRP